jgi:hypothetical protein
MVDAAKKKALAESIAALKSLANRQLLLIQAKKRGLIQPSDSI